MKKFGQFLLVSALSAALLAGCGGSKKAESSAAGSSEAKTESTAASGQKLKVVATIFPESVSYTHLRRYDQLYG